MFRKNLIFVKKFVLIYIFIFITKALAQDIVISPSPLYFGKIPLESSSEREIIIFNTSVNQVTVNSVSITGSNASNFSILNDPGSFTLGAIAKKSITVKYVPSGNDKSSALFNISSSVGAYTDSLIGNGVLKDGAVQTFERILGTNEADNANQVKETSDGGFIIAGGTTPPGENYSSLYLMKTDRFGKPIWTSTYGDEDGPDGGADVVETAAGEFMVFGTTDNWGEGGTDMFLVKFSSSGEFIWRKTYGTNNNDAGSAIVATNDGGYALVGQTVPSSGIGKAAYLVKINAEGEEQWSNTYGGESGTDASDMIELEDGSLMLVGFITIGGDFQVYIVKVSSNGNLVWEKNYGGAEFDYGFGICELMNGDLMISGYTSSMGAGARDGYLLKLSPDGDLIWDKAYGFENSDEFKDVVEGTDGTLIAVGNSVTRVTQDDQYSDGYIVKIDSDGNQIWSKLYGGIFGEGFSSLDLTSDSGVIISGGTGSYSKSSDIYLIKIGNSGSVSDIKILESRSVSNKFHLYQNYPNPFNPNTKINFELNHEGFQKVRLVIYDIIGNEIKTVVDENMKSGIYSVDFSAGELSSGIYFYHLTSENYFAAKKMILLK